MKLARFLPLVAALALALSCNELTTSIESEYPIFMSPGVDVATKSAIDGQVFPTTRSMKVSAYYNAPSGRGTSANYFSNTRFTYNPSTGIWAATDTKYWPFSCTEGATPQGTLDLFAYSVSDDGTGACDVAGYTPSYHLPAGAPGTNVAQGCTVVVPDNFSNQYDMLFGRSTSRTRTTSGSNVDRAVSMTMNHAMALIIFSASCNVARDPDSNFGITINSIVLEDAYYGGTVAIDATQPVGSQCTWYPLTGQHGPSASNAGFSLSMSNYDVPTSMMDITAAGNHMGIGGVGILVPEQQVTRFYITYTLHNGKDDAGNPVNNTLTYIYQIPTSGTYSVDGGYWLEGKKYNYQIAFTLTGITITPSVTNWTAQNVAVPIS